MRDTRGRQGRSSYTTRARGAYRMSRSRRLERQRRRRRKILAVRAALAAAVIGIVVAAASCFAGGKKGETLPAQTEAQEDTIIENAVTVDGISIEGMSREEALEAILKAHPWSMTVTMGDETYEVTDLYKKRAETLLDTICAGKPEGEYQVDMKDMKEDAAAEAAAAAGKWDVAAKNGGIVDFNKETGKFVFGEGTPGRSLDQESLAAAIAGAVKDQKYDAAIEAKVSETSPSVTKEQAEKQYKTLCTFTTDTTANEKRNTNVRLAAEALNGVIVQPGAEFSFNKTVGQRTAEKGYQEAAAYNSGEVVQELGGGVCQMSSTLYNAVFRAGMEITFRRSHTFEPNYVTPGQDATVSWDQPDFRFVNTSKAPVGLRASYSNRKATVSVYGIPVLEDGVTWDLYSEKVEELDPPAPAYEEDQTIEPGKEVVKSAGSKGSKWVTYKVVYKDGKEVERVEDHTKTYKGHAPVILRNTSGVVLTPGETTAPAETTPSPTVDGMPEDYVPGESVPSEDLKPEETLPAADGESSGGPGVSGPAGPAGNTGAGETEAAKPSEAEKPLGGEAGPAGQNPGETIAPGPTVPAGGSGQDSQNGQDSQAPAGPGV